MMLYIVYYISFVHTVSMYLFCHDFQHLYDYSIDIYLSVLFSLLQVSFEGTLNRLLSHTFSVSLQGLDSSVTWESFIVCSELHQCLWCYFAETVANNSDTM